MATPTTAHTEAPGGHGPAPFPPFQAEHFPSQLFWLALSFVVLYVLMAKVGLPRVAGILEARRKRIEADLSAAQALRNEAEAALADYEKALADARKRARAIANETRERLLAESEAARKALEADLNARLAKAEKSIAATKAAAMASVREVAVEAAAAVVERLVGTAPPAATVAEAVDRALKRG